MSQQVTEGQHSEESQPTKIAEIPTAASKFGVWWQTNKLPFIIIVVIIFLLLLVCALAVMLFGLDWTGFAGGESKRTITPQGANIEYTPSKTLWDWMQLLLVPTILAVGGFWLNRIQKDREEKATIESTRTEREAADERARVEREAAEKRAQIDRAIAEENQNESTLQDYISKMSELLINHDLPNRPKFITTGIGNPPDTIRAIARARTLTVLQRLDTKRKRSVLEFLHETGLITFKTPNQDYDEPILFLSSANLKNVDLSYAMLSQNNLNNVDLSGANLSYADLTNTTLRGARLRGVNFSGAYLNGTDLGSAYLQETIWTDATLENVDLTNAHDVDPEQLHKSLKLMNVTPPEGNID